MQCRPTYNHEIKFLKIKFKKALNFVLPDPHALTRSVHFNSAYDKENIATLQTIYGVPKLFV